MWTWTKKWTFVAKRMERNLMNPGSLDSEVHTVPHLSLKGLWIQTSHNIASESSKVCILFKNMSEVQSGLRWASISLIDLSAAKKWCRLHSFLFILVYFLCQTKYSTVLLKPVIFYWCIALPQDARQRWYDLDNVIKKCGGKCFSLFSTCSDNVVCFFNLKPDICYTPGTPLWIYCEPFCCRWRPWLKTQSSKWMDLCWSSTGVISHSSKRLNSLQACWDWQSRAYR